MQFRIIVQSAAAEPLIAVGDRPTDHVAKRIMIEVQIECDIVVETYVLRIDRVTLYHTCCERHDRSALPPEEESRLIPHAAPQFAEILLCQLLKVQLRALIDLQIQRIDLSDDRRHVIDDAQFDWRRSCSRLKLLA